MAVASPGAPIRVLIADSQAVIRSGVRLALDEQPDLCVVAEAPDLAEALALARSLRPDVAVVELGLPGAEPREAARLFVQIENLAAVFLAESNDADALAAAVEEGGAAILTKNAPMEQLLDAVRAVGRGRSWRPAHLEARLRGAAADWSSLTPRERDVAALVARGLAYKDVAARLHISDHTVKNHLRRIYDKLDINSRVELAVHGAETAQC